MSPARAIKIVTLAKGEISHSKSPGTLLLRLSNDFVHTKN